MWVYFVFFDELEAKNYSRRGVRVFPLAAAKVTFFLARCNADCKYLFLF